MTTATTMWDDFNTAVQAIDVAALDRAGLGDLAGMIGLTRSVLDGLEARVAAGMRRLGASEASAAEMLRQRTGCSAREAKHRTRRAETLEKMPNVAEALSSGRLTGEHASALARAAAETSPEAVDRDAGLLVEASSVPADAASTKARDWARRRQTDDDLQRLHQWQRRNRSLLFAAGEGGMIAGIAKFDRVSGAQFQNLVEALADRLYRADGGRDNPNARTRAQCRHDALLTLVGIEPAPPPHPDLRSTTPNGHHANPDLRHPQRAPRHPGSPGTTPNGHHANPGSPGTTPNGHHANPGSPGTTPNGHHANPGSPGTTPNGHHANPGSPGTTPNGHHANPGSPGTTPNGHHANPGSPGTTPNGHHANPGSPGTTPNGHHANPGSPGTTPNGHHANPGSPGTTPNGHHANPGSPGTTPNGHHANPGSHPSNPGSPDTTPNTASNGNARPKLAIPRQSLLSAPDLNASPTTDPPADPPLSPEPSPTRTPAMLPGIGSDPSPGAGSGEVPEAISRAGPGSSSGSGSGESHDVMSGIGPGVGRDTMSGIGPGVGRDTMSGIGPGVGRDTMSGSSAGANLGCTCGRGFGPKAQLCIVMDVTYLATNGERGRCEIPGVGAIARSELERLGCDPEIYGILFDERGLALHHGRKTRRVSPQQWRVLLARDRGCVICGAHPNWCQAHHVKYWSLGGPTDIDNLAMLCHAHHRWVHDNEITLRRGPNGWHRPLPPEADDSTIHDPNDEAEGQRQAG